MIVTNIYDDSDACYGADVNHIAGTWDNDDINDNSDVSANGDACDYDDDDYGDTFDDDDDVNDHGDVCDDVDVNDEGDANDDDDDVFYQWCLWWCLLQRYIFSNVRNVGKIW